MKIWNKIKFPLLIALIVFFFAFLRAVAYALPSWSYWFIYPLILIRLFSQDWFDSDILLDIILLTAVFFAVMFVPKPEKWGRLRRYLLRPAISVVLTFALSLGIGALDEALLEHSYDRKIAKAEQLIAEADEIFYYNLSTYQSATPRFTRPEIVHTCGHSHDMILIDYDTHSITFLRDLTGAAYLDIDTFKLSPVETEVVERRIQTDIPLSDPGARLITYFPDLEQPHRTSGITLVMSDGSVYAVTDLVEPSSGYVLFLDLHRDHPVADSRSCP